MLSDVIVEVCTSSTDAVQVKQATATTTDAFNIHCMSTHRIRVRSQRKQSYCTASVLSNVTVTLPPRRCVQEGT